jgi:putative N6-adenine-specific DNA methylase
VKLFAVCAPGIEPFLTQELALLGLVNSNTPQSQTVPSNSEEDSGGIEFEGDLRSIYLSNLELRSASRILVRLGDFFAVSFAELRRRSARLPWSEYLFAGQDITLRVTCHKSRLYHSDAVSERVLAGIGDALGKSRKTAKADNEPKPNIQQLVVVRIINDHCYVSLDSSGDHLHRRGYRLATAKAPLRETLAAAIVLASGWDCVSPFLDPFCGSGTLPIEAALMSKRIPSGFNRDFSFRYWINFKPDVWNDLIFQISPQPQRNPIIQASDRDAGAIKIAIANAERAGVANLIDFSHYAVSSINPPSDPGWLVTNPPYGMRISSNHDLRDLYAQIGNMLRRSCSGWHFSLLSNQDLLFGQTKLKASRSTCFINGGLRVKLFSGIIPTQE